MRIDDERLGRNGKRGAQRARMEAQASLAPLGDLETLNRFAMATQGVLSSAESVAAAGPASRDPGDEFGRNRVRKARLVG